MLTSSHIVQADSVLNAADGGAAGGSNIMLFVLMAVAVVFFLFLPARRQRKVQQEIKNRQDQLVPGTAVMTNFGLFGTVVEVNREENYALLEISTTSIVKVHLSTVTTIVEDQQDKNSQVSPVEENVEEIIVAEDHDSRENNK